MLTQMSPMKKIPVRLTLLLAALVDDADANRGRASPLP